MFVVMLLLFNFILLFYLTYVVVTMKTVVEVQSPLKIDIPVTYIWLGSERLAPKYRRKLDYMKTTYNYLTNKHWDVLG